MSRPEGHGRCMYRCIVLYGVENDQQERAVLPVVSRESLQPKLYLCTSTYICTNYTWHDWWPRSLRSHYCFCRSTQVVPTLLVTGLLRSFINV